MKLRKATSRVFAAALLLGLLWAGAAAARIPLGVRAGYTHDDGIDQWHVGAHTRFNEVFPNVDVTPGLEFGFGDNVTIITANGDVTYRASEIVGPPWGLHLGGSLSLNYFDWPGDSDIHLGLSALVGVSRQLNEKTDLFTEVRIGILDSPDLKITLGATFF